MPVRPDRTKAMNPEQFSLNWTCCLLPAHSKSVLPEAGTVSESLLRISTLPLTLTLSYTKAYGKSREPGVPPARTAQLSLCLPFPQKSLFLIMFFITCYYLQSNSAREAWASIVVLCSSQQCCLVWMPSIGPHARKSPMIFQEITLDHKFHQKLTVSSVCLALICYFLDYCPGFKQVEMSKCKLKYLWEEELQHLNSPFSRCLHGKCMAANVAYTCKCMEGYTGTYCDKKNNSSNPCRILKCNHGQCKISEHGEPYCECDPNYSGDHCDRGMLGHKDQDVGLLCFCFTSFFSLLFHVTCIWE